MFAKLIINAGIISAVALGGVLYLDYKAKTVETNTAISEAEATTAATPTQRAKPVVNRSASVVSIPKGLY